MPNIVSADIDVPPDSAVLVPVCAGSDFDTTVLFVPSPGFATGCCFLLPFAAIDIHYIFTNAVVSNPSLVVITLLNEECLRHIEFIGLILTFDTHANTAQTTHIYALAPGTATVYVMSLEMFQHSVDSDLEQLLILLNQLRYSSDRQELPWAVRVLLFTTSKPVIVLLCQRLCRVSPPAHRIITEQVHDVLQHSIIQPSSSPLLSLVACVKKMHASARFCIGYR